MSKYYVNKFLYTVDRDPELMKRYAEDPRNLVATWEQSIGPRLIGNDVEESTVVALTDHEREALINHDYVALFEMGAHFFLNLTMYIGIFDEPYIQKSGPLSFQREFAAKLQHWKGREYPTVEV
ncbi:hypothetical protein [Rhizobium sp. YS-1r]|uniref:Extradiol ring-cleavage dioxygenase LigAB LigA subunit domain-containing protein n=1 Tax=Neorhizobium phenanthreniclasticum TaxID=3157917 RepID=A0ABV0M4T3_9HYPH|nr:hypothetical protein [Rhizobium sp. YS-1r]KGE02048.1 hypothetical protein JL39_00450 [Rhizobium sp. YS-1r]